MFVADVDDDEVNFGAPQNNGFISSMFNRISSMMFTAEYLQVRHVLVGYVVEECVVICTGGDVLW